MNRHEATRRVMMSLSAPGGSQRLRYVAPDGSRPIVVCTPNEYLSDVLARVDALGGAANLVLAEVKRFHVLTITSAEVDEAEGAKSQSVNPDVSMGMFWIRTSQTSRRNVFHLAGIDATKPVSFAYA